jgi:hypothetical protein
MIWHIFKKDIRLMWPFVTGLILLAALDCRLETVTGTVVVPGPMSILLQLLPYVLMLGIAVITVMVVQQDNLLGDRHDWLLRPIHSRSVLSAKLLFVGVAVHGPLLLIDLLELESTGLSVRQSFIASLSHQLVMFSLLTTPALMIGATTRNVVGALGLSVGLVILFAGCLLSASLLGINAFGLSPIQTGFSWLVAWTTGLIYVALIMFLATFQYRERRETLSRILGVTVSAAAIALLGVFPWGPALQAQRSIDGAAEGEKAIALTFSPDPPPPSDPAEQETGMRRSPEASGGVLAPVKRGRDLNILDLISGIHVVTLPVQIIGLPVGDVMVSDKGIFRIVSTSGKTIFATTGAICAHLDRGGASGTHCVFAELRAHRSGTDHGSARGEIHLPLPTSLYAQIKTETVRMTLEFTLTWLGHNGPQFMHAVRDRKIVNGIGLCTTGVDHDADDIELRCMTSVRQPSCVGALLRDSRAGSQNPELFGCSLDYAPFPANWIPPALIKRTGADLPFLDPDGLAQYPVDSSRIGEADVVLDTYMPRAHFNRHLDISSIRLTDWEHPVAKR